MSLGTDPPIRLRPGRAQQRTFREVLRDHWCRRGESNPRPRDYETLALPLSYAGGRQPLILRRAFQFRQAWQVGKVRPRRSAGSGNWAGNAGKKKTLNFAALANLSNQTNDW